MTKLTLSIITIILLASCGPVDTNVLDREPSREARVQHRHTEILKAAKASRWNGNSWEPWADARRGQWIEWDFPGLYRTEFESGIVEFESLDEAGERTLYPDETNAIEAFRR